MPDTKITALTALTAADPANDVLPIVDVSDTTMAASGTTKKISINNVLGCSGTATLASATITGDLTVDTSTLKVDSANNRVIVGHTSGSSAFQVTNAGAAGLEIQPTGFSSAPLILSYNRSAPAYTQLTLDGSTIVHALSGTTAMTLNSTGLGVGGSPSGNAPMVLVEGAAGTYAKFNSKVGVKTWSAGYRSGTLQYEIQEDGTERFVIANGGNVGIGVIPKPWRTGARALQLGANGYVTLHEQSNGNANLCFAAYEGSANVFNYTTTGDLPSRYVLVSGTHQWYNAPSGTAGNNITFTQAMTLDASGNLLVGTTTNAGVRLDVQTTTGNCIGRVKSNAAASTASFIIDYVETLGCTYIKKAGSDVWIYGVQNDTSATPAFKINTASNVGVQLVSGATAWTTLSDETVKDIIEPISNAVAKVGSIRSVIGKFKTDDSSKRRSFLIAQDVQSVLPEAVDVVGENNELGLRYTEVIPLMVAAIKELTAEVNALKNA